METDLEKLLDLSELASDEEVKNRFEQLATILFENHHIQKGDVLYDFLEIEFYYYSREHIDIITYPRTANAGEWFFHMSGVDITFKSKSEYRKEPNSKVAEGDFFGGILIRSLQRHEKGISKIITGPYNCMDDLFDKFNALDIPQNFPCVVRNEFIGMSVLKTTRWIPPFNTNNDEDNNKKYEIFKSRYSDNINRDEYLKANFISKEYRYYKGGIGKEIKSYKASPWR
ncbi:MAG: aguA 2 [Bacteroidetes bacterium]|nr:aguA 2 [Bacteroidota bacterium]